MPAESSVNEFIEAVLAGNAVTVERLLVADPALPGADLYAAAVSGNLSAVTSMLRDNPSLALLKGGPREWEPMLYASFSRGFAHAGRPAPDRAGVVRLLLDAGADPNTSYIEEHFPDSPQSALYGATGVANDPAVAEALLSAGADPNDGESIYHAAEGNHRECLELLLHYGADPSARGIPWNNTPLYFLLGYREGQKESATEGACWLLEHGADPNVTSYEIAETPLHLAVRNGRRRATVAMLLDHGADSDLPNARGLTPFALAMRFGNREAMELLRERGADTTLSVVDRLLGACFSGDHGGLREILADRPDLIASLPAEDCAPLIDAAANNNITALRSMLDAGFDIATTGEGGATALHHAAWRGQEDAVAMILAYHPPLDVRCSAYRGTPMDWALHGSTNCGNPDGNYAGIVERLIAAGADIPDVDWGSVTVVDLLRRVRAADC
ncbi:MAG: Ankyrin repeat-containing protein [Chlorobi bacterium]|nr:Ankyrin repeat-containing protein [Chlorobiota bacterium]